MLTTTDPEAVYQARHAVLTTEAAVAARLARRLRLALTVLVLLTFTALVFTLEQTAPGWTVAFPLLGGAFVLVRVLRVSRARFRIDRLLALYVRALGRVDGSAPQSGHTGEEFRSSTHLYDRDLAILGTDSLFGLLATVRTGVGQRGLAETLLQPLGREESLARQRAIQELAPLTGVREEIQLLGTSDFQQVAATFFDAWLDDPAVNFHPAFRYVVLLTGILVGLMIAAGLFHLAPWAVVLPKLLAVLAIQSAIGLYLRPRIAPILKQAENLTNQMQLFRDGLALLQATVFESPKLLALQQLSREPHNAVPALAGLENQFVIVEQRTKQWFYIPSLLFSAGTHAALSISLWKRRHAAAMKLWLGAWAEFETLNALATYAFEHPGNIYPEILPEGPGLFEATALAHPLLPASAVANDIALRPQTSLYLISGSNMAGKSTLLRAIGTNAVLGAVGAPIRASAGRLTPLALGASIALSDSLAEGKSKFLAEVERLHAILQMAQGKTPVLFLIDEIFSGTNSPDRRLAAETVARTLTARGAIGALSTHDLTLTEMATNPALRAVNVHMASPDPADPLAFDFRLKPGINPSTNALAILRLIGIDLPE